MALPSNLTTITVTGNLMDAAGNPVAGSVMFEVPAMIQDVAGPATFPLVPFTASLGNGAFSAVLPCTDNAAFSPTNWGYTVTIQLASGGGFGYQNVAIPHTLGSTVDLSVLLPPSVTPVINPNVNGVTAWNNVRAYGAVGNASHDDTTAIQAAINAAHTASPTGGVVYFPPGNYKTTSPLTLYPHITLRGDGPQVSQISMTTTNTHVVTGVDLSYVSVEGLWLEGTSSGTGRGVNFTLSSNASTPYVRLEDVTVADCGGDGINIANPIASLFSRVNAQTNGGDGFSIHGVVSGAAGTSTAFAACYAIANVGTGFNVYNMTGVSLAGIASDNHTTAGKAALLIDTCNGVTVNGADIENNAIGIKVNAGNGNKISGYFNFGQPSGGVGLWATGSTNDLILDAIVESGPSGSATAWVKTDSGCNVTILSSNHSTANSLSGTQRLQVLESALTFIKTGASTATIDNFGGTLVTNANVALPVGKTLRVPTGTNAAQGTVTANGTTGVTVSTTAASTNANIYYTLNTPAGTVGQPYTSAVAAGTSFTFKSTNAADTSTYNWMMIGTT